MDRRLAFGVTRRVSSSRLLLLGDARIDGAIHRFTNVQFHDMAIVCFHRVAKVIVGVDDRILLVELRELSIKFLQVIAVLIVVPEECC